MTTRARLPSRREAETFDIQVAGVRYTRTVGRCRDGGIAKISFQSDANARDAPVAASVALQFGCPLEILRRALLRNPAGRPSTPLGVAIDSIAERSQ
jgi:hypothetical protein